MTAQDGDQAKVTVYLQQNIRNQEKMDEQIGKKMASDKTTAIDVSLLTKTTIQLLQ